MKVRKKHILQAHGRLMAEETLGVYWQAVFYTRGALRDWHGWPLISPREDLKVAEETDEAAVDACVKKIKKQHAANQRKRERQDKEARLENEKRKADWSESYRRLRDEVADLLQGSGGVSQADLRMLGLSSMPDIAGLKDAYRRMAMKHHPDCGGDEKTFISINSAYERLARKQLP